MCCCTLQSMNMSLDDQMEYTSSQLLIPWGTQYPEDGVPHIVKSCKHRGPLLNSNDGKAFPMYSVGNFSLDNALFPSVPRDSFLYDGDVHDKLIQQGFDIPIFVDNSSLITAVPVPVSASSRSLAVPVQDDTTSFIQAPDSQLLVHLPLITANCARSSQVAPEEVQS